MAALEVGMASQREAYEFLESRSTELHVVGAVGGLIGWDQAVNMPPKGAAFRARMSAWVAGQSHAMATDPAIGEALDTAEGGDWEAGEAANLREWRRGYDLSTKIPADLVRRKARATSEGHEAWKEARASDDFEGFAPILARLIDLAKETAEHLGYPDEPYDALVDLYQAGLTTKRIETVFEPLGGRLKALAENILDWQGDPGADPLEGEYAEEEQRAFDLTGAKHLGFDFDAGRLDTAPHPFCSGFCTGDVRLTTRYNPADPLPSYFGTLHETGHGLYEQGLPAAHEGTPLGDSVSLSIHESQSLFFESMVGQDPAYWAFMLPKFKEAFPGRAPGLDLDGMSRRVNRVQRSLIRVEADEVTYPLHVILRFEIERDLFRGEIGLRDLPGAWHDKMEEHVGIRPTDDADGVLQDIHWSMGGFGYFSTYAMGRLHAAQFAAAMEREIPGWRDALADGDVSPALGWMRANVHAHGTLWRTDELVERVTGSPPSADYYLDYLEKKYRAIFA